MVAGRETFTRGREIFLRGREIFARGRDVSGLWRETLLERVSATFGATTGATIGVTTGVGKIFANLLIISFGVTTPDVHGLYYCTIWLLCLKAVMNKDFKI